MLGVLLSAVECLVGRVRVLGVFGGIGGEFRVSQFIYTRNEGFRSR
jgi:hypothetical protein